MVKTPDMVIAQGGNDIKSHTISTRHTRAAPDNPGVDDKDNLSFIWRRSLLYLTALWFALLAIFWTDAVHMADIWWNISTYNHCLIVLAILGWYVTQRKEELKQIRPYAFAPGLLWLAGGAFTWMLGDAAGVATARHLGLIVMWQGSVITLLGPRVVHALLYPLFYSFLLWPVGEELVPSLQVFTAKLSMLLLNITEIPAYMEGVFITTPGGYFEVAEACSGVRFLVAMIAFGAFVANLCFESWARRFFFMIFVIVVPIIANGIRAFGTIYIADKTGIEFAASFDHIFYGWIFFGLVLGLIMLVSYRFFDRAIDAQMVHLGRLVDWKWGALRMPAAFITAIIIAVSPFIWSAVIETQARSFPEKPYAIAGLSGWQEGASITQAAPWKARFEGSTHHKRQQFIEAQSGIRVDVDLIFYNRQEEGREIVGYGQGGRDPESDWAWTSDGTSPEGGYAQIITAPGPVVREIVTYYQISGQLTGSKTKVKWETLKSRLIGTDPRAVAILISAEDDGNGNGRKAIDNFTKALTMHYGSINALADQVAGRV